MIILLQIDSYFHLYKILPFSLICIIYLAAGFPLLIAWRCFVFDWPSPPSRRDEKGRSYFWVQLSRTFKAMGHILTNKSHERDLFIFIFLSFLALAEMPTPIVVRPSFSSPSLKTLFRSLYSSYAIVI